MVVKSQGSFKVVLLPFSFYLNDHTKRFNPRLKSKNHLVQHNRQYHKKVVLTGNSIHMNGRGGGREGAEGGEGGIQV